MAERRDLLWLLMRGERAPEMVWSPAADVYRTSYGWLVKVELAGVNPEDVEILLEGTDLHIRGVRRDMDLTECLECYQMELVYSRFERVVSFPRIVNPRRIETDYLNGLLIIRLVCEGG
jgi:HSP20 family protein